MNARHRRARGAALPALLRSLLAGVDRDLAQGLLEPTAPKHGSDTDRRPGQLFAARDLVPMPLEPLSVPLDLCLALSGIDLQPDGGIFRVWVGEQDEAHARARAASEASGQLGQGYRRYHRPGRTRPLRGPRQRSPVQGSK